MENPELIKNFLNICYDTGYGSGYGSGYGCGYGYGSASGCGYGCGSGYDTGDGSGYGSGYGCGYGSASGCGYGSGTSDSYNYIREINNHKIYIIDKIPVVINKIKFNIVQGDILNKDLTLTPCFIIKNQNFFAHGTTLQEAKEALF